MKILILTDKMDIGGAETHILTLVSRLIEYGHDITVLSAGGAYIQALRDSGAKCLFAPLDKRGLPSVIASARAVRRLLGRFDIIHAHTRYTSFLAHLVRGKRNYPAIVVTAHLNFKPGIYKRLTKWGDITLSVSDDITHYLKSVYKISEEKIIPTRNGIDTRQFMPSNSWAENLPEKINPEAKLVIHSTRIDGDRSKTAFLLADGSYDFLVRHPNFQILIIGDGELFQKLRERVIAVNKRLREERIILLGKRSDISRLLPMGDFFVGVSRSALEAMACGLPCIISGDEGYGGIIDSASAVELMASNLCARGFPEATAQRLFSDMETLAHESDYKEELREFGRNFILREYSARRMAEDANRAYKTAEVKPSVCLVGYFGYGNLGDEQTLETAITQLTSRGIKSINVLWRKKTGEPKHDSPGIEFYSRYNFLSVMKAIKKSDAVIMCGGNLLQNETSLKSLLYYSTIMRYAKRRGKKLYMISSGIGKLTGKIANGVSKSALKRADFIGARTHADLEKFAEGAGTLPDFMPDLCYFTKSCVKKKAEASKFLAIASNPQFISLAKRIRSLTNTDFFVTTICEGDREKIEEICKRGGIEYRHSDSFATLEAMLADASFAITERLHGALFSIISHTAVYLSDEKEKNRAFIAEVTQRGRLLGTNPIVFPLKSSRVADVKKVGAKSSDFEEIINFMRSRLNYRLDDLFGEVSATYKVTP